MILDFTLKNFMSFSQEVSLNMLAAKTVKENETTDENSNVWALEDGGPRVLRAAAVYGANGSGKSNLLQAMLYFKNMILGSVVDESIIKQSKEMFYRLNEDGAKEPISMQMILSVDGIKYRYGFELLNGQVKSEWLFVQPLVSHSKESYAFTRENSQIKINSKIFKGASGLMSKTRSNALFLSICFQFNVEMAMILKEWFRKRLNFITGLDDTIRYTANQYLHDEMMHEKISKYMCMSNIGIKDVNVTERNVEVTNGQVQQLDITVSHDVYINGKVVGETSLPLSWESLGTNKLFSLLGPWFDTLQHGGVIIMDEFGTSLHTKMAAELLKLFYSSLNIGGAQLIVATHDTNLLRHELLRRDQIWFTEKDDFGSSDLYSLVEYKVNQATSVRNDASLSKDYLAGKYGAIPYFGNIEQFVAEYGKE